MKTLNQMLRDLRKKQREEVEARTVSLLAEHRMQQLFMEPGERGSDDIRAHTTPEGVTLELIGGDGEAWTDIKPDAALRLGEWLIAQAIAQGAGR